MVYLSLGWYALDLLALPWFVTTIEFTAQSLGMKILYVVLDLYNCASSAVGLYGCKKRDPDYIYIFFLSCILSMFLTALYWIVAFFEYGAGHLQKTFVAICEHKDHESEHKCAEEGSNEAIASLVAIPFQLLFMGIFAYYLRKFYIIVLKEKNGFDNSYNRFELEEEV